MKTLEHALRVARLRRITHRLIATTVLTCAVAGSALAQDDSAPPALVGRIAALHGQVSMHRSDQQDWSEAGINEPITVGDAIYVQQGGDARLQIGATDMDLRSDSEIDVAALDEDTGRIRLDSGTLDLRVSDLPTSDGLFILTPRGTVRLTQPGTYRIEAGTEDDPTRVTAWSGAAQLGDSSAAVSVQAGQVLVISGTPEAPQYAYLGDIGQPPDAWREPARAVAATSRYVPPDMTGAEDLYTYGSFQTVPEYGAVWYPNDVSSDWQPYRYGHWDYVAPWGQTWVDDQPWGFAPFHYGRWAFIGGRWGWCPGEYHRHPIYAPALVAFVGGGGFSASISFGGGDAVGWVPLAPGEVYRPYYRAGPRYIENINRTVIVNRTVINNTVINNYGQRGLGGFANRRFATVTPAEAIARGRPVAQAVIRVPPERLEHAPVDQQVVAHIRPVPGAVHPAARPGPTVPPPALRGNPTARPTLPPARGRGPGEGPRPVQPAAVPGAPISEGQAARPDRPGPIPGLPARPGPEHGQPVRPEAGRPDAGRPEAGRPVAGRPEPQRPEPGRAEPGRSEAPRPAVDPNTPPAPIPNRPDSRQPPQPAQRENPFGAREGRPGGIPPAPVPPRQEPNRERPNIPRPGADRQEGRPMEPPRPAEPRPTPPRPEPNRQAPPPESRPAPQPRPEFHASEPPRMPQRPAPQAAEPPRAPAPRPEFHPPQMQRPEPRPQPPMPRPEPRPQPQPQPRPQPQPAPHPQPAPQPVPQPHPQPQQGNQGHPGHPDPNAH